MNAERYRRLQTLFDDLCDTPADVRRQRLEALRDTDPDIAAEVERLLSRDAATTPILDPATAPPLDRQVVIDLTTDTEEDTPTQIGDFTIKRLIARGGMGAVYEAQQSSPQRIVALKVLRSGITTPANLRRFDLESQVLARLDHPGIARIFEAGTADTSSGTQPYFAMEYVSGQPVVEYANAEQLTSAERIELLARICDAVHHAHQKGVIHRDIKPSNVLVRKGADQIGEPKVLDFGVARLTDASAEAATHDTQIGQVIGTLPYMSPEQAAGDPQDIDTRSDVYALGVLGYELLGGSPPHDLRGKKLHEALRHICTRAPDRLGEHHPALRGDVEMVIGAALSIDRALRYDSAAAMASDLRRVLANQPIATRPPSGLYTFRKFARRNRVPLAIGIAFALTLIATSSIAVLASVDARHEKLEAIAALDESEAVTDFLASMLESSNPALEGRDVRVRELLDTASRDLPRTMKGRPNAHARLLLAIGRAYHSLGESDLAEMHLVDAVERYETSLGGTSMQALMARSALGRAVLAQARLDDAEQILIPAAEDCTEYLGRTHHTTLRTEIAVGELLQLQSHFEDSARRLRAVTETLGENHVLLPEAKIRLAETLDRMGLHQDAITLLRTVYEPRTTGGTSTAGELLAVAPLAAALLRSGDFRAARLLLDDSLPSLRDTLGQEHPSTMYATHLLAISLSYLNESALAEDTFREVIALRTSALGESHPATLNSKSHLASMMMTLGRNEEAEPLLLSSVEAYIRELGEDHPNTAGIMDLLARLHRNLDELDEAESWGRRAVAASSASAGESNADTRTYMNSLANVLTRQGKYEEAESIYHSLLRVDDTAPSTLLHKFNLAKLFQTTNRLDEAASLYAEVDAQRDLLQSPFHHAVLDTSYGEVLARTDDCTKAVPYLLSGIDFYREAHSPTAGTVQVPLPHLVKCLDALGRSEEAAEYRAMLVAPAEADGSD